MSYIGNTATTQAFTPAVDIFSGNGSTTAFTLSRPVASVAQVEAVIENVVQSPVDAYTISGNTITFTSAPPSGTSNIYVRYTSPITQVIQPGQGTVGPTQVATNYALWNLSGSDISYSAGNVGIGTSSPNYRLDVAGTANATALGTTLAYGIAGEVYSAFRFNNSSFSGGNSEIRNIVNGAASTGSALAFLTTQTGSGPLTERARIDNNGNLLVGTTDPSQSGSVGLKLINSTTLPVYRIVVNTANAGDAGIVFANANATYTGFRFYVTANGGIYNYSGNNVNLSDERTKTNIELADGYLDKICSIPVKLFNYKDEAEGEQRTLGVVAQDVEAVAPELVNIDGFGDTPEDGIPLKSIYTTDLQFALMKCIQEQQALITTLTERITALEAK